MADAKPRTEPLHVRDDGGCEVVLHPEDNDLFVRTGKQVIDACRLGISVEVWVEEVTAMLGHVRAWAEAQNGRVRAAYCVPRGTRVVLFFVPASDAFDFDLADALAAINVELMKRFNVGTIEVRQVPWSEVDRFLDTSRFRAVYGDQAEPHRPVAS